MSGALDAGAAVAVATTIGIQGQERTMASPGFQPASGLSGTLPTNETSA